MKKRIAIMKCTIVLVAGVLMNALPHRRGQRDWFGAVITTLCLVGATTLIAAQAASPPIQWNAIVRRDAPPSVFVDLVHAVHRNQAKQACHRAATIFAKASALPPGTRPFYAFSVMGEGLRIAEPASLFGKDACLIQLQPPALSLEGPPIPMS